MMIIIRILYGARLNPITKEFLFQLHSQPCVCVCVCVLLSQCFLHKTVTKAFVQTRAPVSPASPPGCDLCNPYHPEVMTLPRASHTSQSLPPSVSSPSPWTLCVSRVQTQ